jgi:hypothetical protein
MLRTSSFLLLLVTLLLGCEAGSCPSTEVHVNASDTERPGLCANYCPPASVELEPGAAHASLVDDGRRIVVERTTLAVDLEIIDRGPDGGPPWSAANVVIAGTIGVTGVPNDHWFASIRPEDVEVQSITVNADHADVQMRLRAGHHVGSEVQSDKPCDLEDNLCSCDYVAEAPLPVHLSLAL